MTIEPEIREMESFKVIGMKYQGKNGNEEVPQLWRDFVPRIKEIKNVSRKEDTFGLQWDIKDDGQFMYIAGIKVEMVENVPEGMISWDIPKARYATFECTLPTLLEVYGQISEWLEKSEYSKASSPEFEYYPREFDGSPDSKMYIYIPITK